MHSAYVTDVPEEAESFLSRAYVDLGLTIPDDADGFRLAVDRLDGGAFQIDSIEIGARAAFRLQPDQEFFVSTITRGSLRVRQRGIDEQLQAGELVLTGRPGVE